MTDRGSGTTADPKAATALLEKGCSLSHGRACFMLATRLEDGTGAERDYKRSAEIYKQACDDLGEPDACDRLAKMYTEGRGVSQDTEAALAIHRKGCDLGRPAACSALAHVYEDGAPGLK